MALKQFRLLTRISSQASAFLRCAESGGVVLRLELWDAGARVQGLRSPFHPRWQPALLLVAGLGVSCSHGPRPCRTPTACDTGFECLANRCVPEGGEPVAAEAMRALPRLTEMAVIDRDGRALPRLPPTVTFGSERGQDHRLLVRFEPVWESMTVEAAFLLLTPDDAAVSEGSDSHVTVSRIAEEWSTATLPSAIPLWSSPRANGLGRSSSTLPLRVDVTEIVRVAQTDPDDHHGFALQADGHTRLGATYTTGVLVGEAPVLEVYGTPAAREATDGDSSP